MDDFKMRFAEHNDTGFYFTNVRSGLIVGLVS
jgi:SP family sugar:H+ symporter-like MFS transporter